MTVSQQQRLAKLKNEIWIPYPKAEEIRRQLEDLLTHPSTHRMPNLAVIGETNNGKTKLLKTFVAGHNPIQDPNEEACSLPILMIETPPRPDEGRLYSELLRAINIEFGARVAPESKLDRLRAVLPRLGTKMIILDEFSNALAGSYAAQRQFLNGLKYLGNQLQIPIVVSGVPEALGALRLDPQLANRFKPAFLPKWSVTPELYARLLMSFETQLQLENACDFRSKRVVQRMLDLTGGGIIGETSELLRLLAADAIRTGKEAIDADSLTPQKLQEISWSKPEERTRYSA